MALDNYKITSTDINAVHMEALQGESLRGSVLQNKQRFDWYPDMISGKFNSLCEYVGTQSPSGDSSLLYSPTEVLSICTTLNCNEEDITM